MRTYISPIGYDTRRVTRPVIKGGIGPEDEVVLLRPADETDEERAHQTIADVENLLHEIEPNYEQSIRRVDTDHFARTVMGCSEVIGAVPDERECIVSLSGGARDILLPLTVAAQAHVSAIDTILFFSDLDNTVSEWELPDLTAQIPDRTVDTFEVVVSDGGWRSVGSITEATDQSRSTVIRHVNDLEDSGVIEADTSGKAKQVRVTISGELLWRARASGQ